MLDQQLNTDAFNRILPLLATSSLTSTQIKLLCIRIQAHITCMIQSMHVWLHLINQSHMCTKSHVWEQLDNHVLYMKMKKDNFTAANDTSSHLLETNPAKSHKILSACRHLCLTVCQCLSVSNCPSSSPSVFVSIFQSIRHWGLFTGEGTVYPACEPNNSPSPSTSLGYGLFAASEHVFVHEGKCVHAGLSQDLINSWKWSVHLTETDPCTHH